MRSRLLNLPGTWAEAPVVLDVSPPGHPRPRLLGHPSVIRRHRLQAVRRCSHPGTGCGGTRRQRRFIPSPPLRSRSPTGSRWRRRTRRPGCRSPTPRRIRRTGSLRWRRTRCRRPDSPSTVSKHAGRIVCPHQVVVTPIHRTAVEQVQRRGFAGVVRAAVARLVDHEEARWVAEVVVVTVDRWGITARSDEAGRAATTW